MDHWRSPSCETNLVVTTKEFSTTLCGVWGRAPENGLLVICNRVKQVARWKSSSSGCDQRLMNNRFQTHHIYLVAPRDTPLFTRTSLGVCGRSKEAGDQVRGYFFGMSTVCTRNSSSDHIFHIIQCRPLNTLKVANPIRTTVATAA